MKHLPRFEVIAFTFMAIITSASTFKAGMSPFLAGIALIIGGCLGIVVSRLRGVNVGKKTAAWVGGWVTVMVTSYLFLLWTSELTSNMVLIGLLLLVAAVLMFLDVKFNSNSS
jgi:hypothetical protein